MPTPNLPLKYERQQRGWSQSHLAEQIDVPDYYISRWERGEVLPSPLYQQKLCELFNKTAQELGFLQVAHDTPLPGTLSLDMQPDPIGSSTGLTDASIEQVPFPPLEEPLSVLSAVPSHEPSPTPLETRPVPSPVPLGPTPPRHSSRSLRRSFVVMLGLALVALIILVGSLILKMAALVRPAHTPSVVGQVDFFSSGQLNDMTNQGIADEVRVDLHNLASSAAGKSYYAWLLPDANLPENPSLLLGKVALKNGGGSVFYQDPQFTNLLASMSRFLITQEDASATPLTPSSDPSRWRYQGQIPNTRPLATPGEASYSVLDHVRHLLSSDPTVRAHGLTGGLIKWLVLNTDKVAEWASAARGEWHSGGTFETQLLRRHLTRILDYLDGTTLVELDVPTTGTPAVLVDPQVGSLGLLQFTPQQRPPGYLNHIEFHLHGLISAPGATTQQQQRSGQIEAAINRINGGLEQARQDAKQLMEMTDTQLRQPAGLTILNDLHIMAAAASTGTTDPATGTVQEGAEQVEQQIQDLAIVDVTPYTR